MTQATFIIDLARCTGCYACQIACKDRADLPDDLDWLRIEERETGSYPTPSLTFRVVHCFHCAEPLCAEACPSDAIKKGNDGLVAVDAGECIGCEACIDACPFEAILMAPEGVAAKCDGCASEVGLGWEPTCVRACPMRALGFVEDGRARSPSLRGPDETFNDHGIGPGVVYLV